MNQETYNSPNKYNTKRRISHFSCGAASAVATKISRPDEIWYADTGSEDKDNHRFFIECEKWFNKKIIVLKSDKYTDTWDVWEKRKYISGISGAPCTSELKIIPQTKHQRPDDVHIFGYTADSSDVRRAENFREHFPDLHIEVPLIDRGLTKAACIELVKKAGILPPRIYSLGFPNANCIPCCKATSPAYWSLVRKQYPIEFSRMSELSRRLKVTLARFKGKRVFIDEIPENHPTSNPIIPECDMLCHLAESEIFNET